MRTLAVQVGLAVGVIASSLQLHSQLVLITVEQPFQSQTLTGVIYDQTGATVFGAHVEERDSTFKRVKKSTWTDEDGRFALPKGRAGTTHYLRVSKDGFDPMQITVELKRSAERGLKITLQVAT